jgi:predicted adenine nucleotide alpha hydrolase (AANH) superfamily ATPase/N-acetylglutamate synthase-like GNAT family acetyltransferase
MKLLLHTCCAPCSVYCIESLREEGIEPIIYWYNPNIHPYTEYKERRNTLKKYAEMIECKAIFEEDYGLKEFCKNVIKDLEHRCSDYCYKIRLEQTAKYAKENGYTAFTTTLLISPYQNHNELIRIGQEMAKKYNIEFLYRDFRHGFKDGQTKARELGLYMQKYCGCIFSEESRYNCHNPAKPELPEGYELPSRTNIQVKKIENKEDYIDLLLEADPSKDMISKYLNDSDVYGLKVDEEIVSVAVILHIDKNTLELKNLVTKEEYRNKGYSKKLLKSLCGNCKQKYSKMLVGTTENNIPFYVKQGFDKYEKTIKNFFVDNYTEEIWDGDLHCTDLIYYSKDLKKINKCNY